MANRSSLSQHIRHHRKLICLMVFFSTIWSITGCGAVSKTVSNTTDQPVSTSPSFTSLIVFANQASVQAGATDSFTVTEQGLPAAGGTWSVVGGFINGNITVNGLYTAPQTLTSAATVTVEYALGTNTGTATILLVSPATSTPIAVVASQATVDVGQTDSITATQLGMPVYGGQWVVFGGTANGSITATGLYSAPSVIPAPANVMVGYVLGSETNFTSILILDPAPVVTPQSIPVITSIVPNSTQRITTSVQIAGSGFSPSAQVLINGSAVPTTFVNSTNLSASITLQQPISAVMDIAVLVRGNSQSNSIPFTANFPAITVQPSILAGGSVSLTVTGSSFAPGDVVTMNGTPLVTTVKSSTQLTATGFLNPWNVGTAAIEVLSGDGTSALAVSNVPILPTAVSFDAAARFSTQAALGPRPDVVLHIQQVGFDAFITEQFAQPAISFISDGPRTFLMAAATGNSLLRQRVSLALQSFIVPQNEDFDPSAWFIEDKFENDASGNFRQLMTDVVGDPNITQFLNLPGNMASTNSEVQPNQNFARELMQLFTLGPILLNDDGSQQLDSNGQTIPTYTQATVIDLTRALTGWMRPPIVNPQDTEWGIDFSQTLVADEQFHDHNSKQLFGVVYLPSGQTTEQDTTSALDAIFAHPNLPPFISHLLIQHLVKSNPSPAYIQRISSKFEDDGTGVRGNMQAVVRAILLDPEARSGDTTPDSSDGFLHDPLLFQIFAMSAIQQSLGDDQANYDAGYLGQQFWFSPTVFGAYSPNYVIPGTKIGSPEFMLFNNIYAIQRTDMLWGIINCTLPGYNCNYPSSSWLLQNFTTVPNMIDALNHLLDHGTMTQKQQLQISNYSSQLNPFDIQQQLLSSMFLALNSDSFNVSH